MLKRLGTGREGASRTAAKTAVLPLEGASRRSGFPARLAHGFNVPRALAAVLAVVAWVLLSLPVEASRGGNPGLDLQAFSKPPELLSSVAQSSVALRRSGEAIRFRLDGGVPRSLSESLEEAFVTVDLYEFEPARLDALELAESVPAGLTFEARFERSILEGLGDRVTLGAKPPPCNGLCIYAWEERSTYSLRARWYDPRTAQFLSEDPLDDIDSPNVYGYVAGRPHEARDPWGLTTDIDFEQRLDRASEGVKRQQEWCRSHPAECEAEKVRSAGAIQAAGGLGQIAGGLFSLFVPEPTFGTKVLGFIAVGRGADNLWTGIRQAWTGRSRRTVTGAAIQEALPYYGVASESAEVASLWLEFGLDLLPASTGNPTMRLRHGTNTAGRVGIDKNGVDVLVGESAADYGRGFHTGNESVARKGANWRAEMDGGNPEIVDFTLSRNDVPDLLDLTRGLRAKQYKEFLGRKAWNSDFTFGDLMANQQYNDLRPKIFDEFLKTYGIPRPDAMYGPLHPGPVSPPGNQLVIFSQEVANKLKRK